jgi:hypothetical protein
MENDTTVKESETKVINLSPKWSDMVNVFVVMIQYNNQDAIEELRRMAKLADLYVASQIQKVSKNPPNE